MLFDVKRVSSNSVSKLKRRVTEKIPRQGPNFVVDLSTSEIRREDAEVAIAWILEDPGVQKIILIKSGNATMFVK